MGKRRKRTTRKWRKKGEETAKEAENVLMSRHAKSAVAALANEELFVIDKSGAGTSDATSLARQTSLVENHAERRKKRKLERRETKREENNTEIMEDLWSATTSKVKSTGRAKSGSTSGITSFSSERTLKRNAKSKTKMLQIPSVEVPGAGLSYHPSKDAHEESMAQVVAKEITRANRIASEKMPIVKPVVAVDDYTSNEEEEDEEDDSDDGTTFGVKPSLLRSSTSGKRKTKAQLNRMQRHKQNERNARRAKRSRTLNHHINMSKKIIAAIESESAAQKVRRETRRQLREEALVAPSKRTIVVGGKRRLHEPVSAIALTSELHGSLRAMKNNGNILKDRFYSMLERGKFELGDRERIRRLEKQQRRKHRPYGKSHWGVDAMKEDAKRRAG